MEAIVLLGLLTSLAVASMRWGHDSRDTIHSKEEELACYGVSWRDLADDGADLSRPLVLPPDLAARHVNGVVHAP